MLAVRTIVFVLGVAYILRAPFSVIRSFIVPRGLVDPLTRTAFITMRVIFAPLISQHRPQRRDRALAFYCQLVEPPLDRDY
jgi:hypothetical protein